MNLDAMYELRERLETAAVAGGGGSDSGGFPPEKSCAADRAFC